MKERDVVEYLKRRVDATGGEYRKLSYEGRTGAPDYLIFYPVELDCTITVPIACFVEVKAPGEKPSVIQQLERIQCLCSGFCRRGRQARQAS